MEKIKTLLKNNKMFYNIYRIVFNIIINSLKIFIKVDENVILFNCFGGKKFDDSPRVIYQYICNNSKYNKYKIYWSFDDPKRYQLKKGTKVKNNTLKYFIIALKAKYWITNSGIERGLKFKNKKTIYINTWHGTTIKKLGVDQHNKLCQFETTKPDIIYAQSMYDVDTLSSAFQIDKEKFALVGLPRNDELVKSITKRKINDIKQKIGINNNKKIILYMPTFREYDIKNGESYIAPPINIDKWEKQLSDEYVLLFRVHYETKKILGIKNSDFIYDVSEYSNLNELLKISDILISDYSSVMFDYSLLERPIYSFAYDYEDYINKRGVYIDISLELPNGICKDEDELLENIKKCDFKLQKEKTVKFKEKYVQYYGQATKYIDEILR